MFKVHSQFSHSSTESLKVIKQLNNGVIYGSNWLLSLFVLFYGLICSAVSGRWGHEGGEETSSVSRTKDYCVERVDVRKAASSGGQCSHQDNNERLSRETRDITAPQRQEDIRSGDGVSNTHLEWTDQVS